MSVWAPLVFGRGVLQAQAPYPSARARFSACMREPNKPTSTPQRRLSGLVVSPRFHAGWQRTLRTDLSSSHAFLLSSPSEKLRRKVTRADANFAFTKVLLCWTCDTLPLWCRGTFEYCGYRLVTHRFSSILAAKIVYVPICVYMYILFFCYANRGCSHGVIDRPIAKPATAAGRRSRTENINARERKEKTSFFAVMRTKRGKKASSTRAAPCGKCDAGP